MKNLPHISVLTVLGIMFFSSCATLTTSYTDDVYYNPSKDKVAEVVQGGSERVEFEDPALSDSKDYVNEEDLFTDDYTDNDNEGYTYANRLRKFHNDDYDGNYYNDDKVYLNVSLFPLGWGVGYHHRPWYYSSYWNPYTVYRYDSWCYDPWYSTHYYGWYSYGPYYNPYYRPYHYGWYDPYYYGYHDPYYYDHYYYHGNNYYNKDKDKTYARRRAAHSGSAVSGGSGYVNRGRTVTESGLSSGASTSSGSMGASVAKKSVKTTRSSGTKLVKEDAKLNGGKTTRSSSTKMVKEEAKLSGVRTSIGNSVQKDLSKNNPRYTRTMSESSRTSSNKSRDGYTPSYTRPKTATFNNSKSNRGSSSYRRPNNQSGYNYQGSSTRNRTTPRSSSSYNRSSSSKPSGSSSYRPSSSRNNSSSRSSYSSGRSSSNSSRSSYSSGRSSSSSSRSTGSSSSSRSNSSRRR